MKNADLLLSDIGEKKLISKYLRPLLNPRSLPESVGDDCAILKVRSGYGVCVSTDRVPADLISFRLGLIGYRELGQYLAVLNISDIAAAGGEPRGLLLNLAFPATFRLTDFLDIIKGAQSAGLRYGAPVVGGDLSTAAEMNLTATSIGEVRSGRSLFRSGAKPGDAIFVSRPVGICPAAFRHFLSDDGPATLTARQLSQLKQHFARPEPLVRLGRALGECGHCSSAMDNTDGVGQSLFEIGEASGVAMVVDEKALPVAPVCSYIAQAYGEDASELALSAGADFQLVGTVRNEKAALIARLQLTRIGHVEEGRGVYLSGTGRLKPYQPRGWNYVSAKA
jgi:thiamine-monophosphate kinase